MKITNLRNLPQAYVNAVTFDDHKKGKGFSVTEMIKPLRMIWLRKRHEDELVEDASKRVWALLGQAIHAILERNAEKDSLQEEYLSAEINGVELTGTPDLLNSSGLLSDWKLTTAWSAVYGSRIKDYTEQLNCYAWLYAKHGFIAKKAEVVAIYRDWDQNKIYSKNYPQYNMERVDIELWLPETQEAFISKRINDIMKYEHTPDNELPLCTPDEKWERPDVWAVMKKGRKSAFRLHDTQKAAEDMVKVGKGKGDEVVLRKGECKRCMKYCPVNLQCNTYLAAAGSPPPVGEFEATLNAAKTKFRPEEATIDMLISESDK